jgi:ribosomal protein L11 methyltransferase
VCADASGGDAPERSWGALRFEVPDELADEAAGRMAVVSRGAELRSLGDGRCTVRIYLSNEDDARAAAPRVEKLLAGLGVPLDAAGLAVERIDDERWVERYQASLEPFEVGQGFRVFPAGHPDDRRDRMPLVLVPGRAFGTGEHATTRLCVEQLERLVGAGSRWLDLGCGTAILSIVAHKRGASRILGVDIDRESIEVAREVLEINGLEGTVELQEGGPEDSLGDDWNGVVANVHAPLFVEFGSRLASFLLPGGILIASGFTVSESTVVEGALADAGLSILDRGLREPWVVLVAGKRGGDP